MLRTWRGLRQDGEVEFCSNGGNAENHGLNAHKRDGGKNVYVHTLLIV